MAVAKTYEKFEIQGEPFIENKRAYVIVKTPKGDKKVRWYSDKEYARMYPDAQTIINTCDYRKALGFKDAGYITIYTGDNEDNEPWFRNQPNCYFHKIWGWYTHSDKEVPTDLPEGVGTKKLYWTNVCEPDGTVSETSAQKGYDMTVFNKNTGNFIGAVGDRLDLVLHVDKIIPVIGRYGEAFMHIMTDEYGNTFVWTTASRTLPVAYYHIKGTVKDHRTYRGVNQTILTRCSGFQKAEMRFHMKEDKVNA